MTPQRFALALGIVLVLLGLTVGAVISVSVEPRAGSYGDARSCGAPWIGTDIPLTDLSGAYGGRTTDFETLCSEKRQSRGIIAVIVLGLGGVAIGASFVRTSRTAPKKTAEA